MGCSKGKWTLEIHDEDNATITLSNGNSVEIFGDDCEANAHLIAAAVNACIKVNPDNPMAVAKSIQEMYEACKAMYKVLLFADDPMEQKLILKEFAALSEAIAKVDSPSTL